MTLPGLTKRQLVARDFIARYVAQHGVSPSFDEIRDALDLRSKSSVSRLLDCLEDRGHLLRTKRRSRSVILMGAPALRPLPAKIRKALDKYCEATRQDPNDVIADAVSLHLDEMEKAA